MQENPLYRDRQLHWRAWRRAGWSIRRRPGRRFGVRRHRTARRRRLRHSPGRHGHLCGKHDWQHIGRSCWRTILQLDRPMIIDPRSWPLEVQMVLILGPWIIMMTGIVMNACIANGRDFERSLSALQSSTWLEQQIRVWGTSSLVSRWVLVGMISGLLASPHKHIRRGQLDAAQVQNFPWQLKRRVLVSGRLIFIGFVLMIISLGLYKICEP
ncbi:hypothetical protein SAMN05216487_3865 [Pseudomonas sp. UC 17F4]|nr:hypothetical protein SAMN05216487_3865 [Pseudomonas sp. UC 17F4]